MDRMDRLAKIEYRHKVRHEKEKKKKGSVTEKRAIWTEETKVSVAIAIIIMLAVNPLTIGVLAGMILLVIFLADLQSVLVIVSVVSAFILLGVISYSRKVWKTREEEQEMMMQRSRSLKTREKPLKGLKHFLLVYGIGYIGVAVMFIITGLLPGNPEHFMLFTSINAALSFIAGVIMLGASRTISSE